ncbi:MAG: hypothetical protein PHG85_03305 [Candidatus Altiarchaeota archaeon]|nr:hypothetical protein [Candidatus Altiarchaeota archaeon]
MGVKKQASLVNGNDFAKVYLKYGLERLVEEGHYATGELSSLDNGGEYTKKLLGDASFRRRLEKAESAAKTKDGSGVSRKG